MSKLTKRVLIVAGCCIVCGLGLLTAGRALGGEMGFWIDRTGIYTNQDIRNRSKENLYVMEKTELDSFNSMEVLVENNNIEIVPSDDGHYYIEYRLYARGSEPWYQVENGVLTVKCVMDKDSSYSYGAGFMVWDTGSSFQRGTVKIYLPEDIPMKLVKLGNNDADLTYNGPDADTYDFTSSYGSMNVSGGKAGKMYLNASDGNITCHSVECDELILNNNYGKTDLSAVTTGKLTIDASDGRISMKQIMAGSISIKNTYGGLTGKEITADSFYVKMADGSCDLETADLKESFFENTYGTVKVELTGGEKDYNYQVESTYGSVKVGGSSYKEEGYQKDNGAKRSLTVNANDGNVVISFTE